MFNDLNESFASILDKLYLNVDKDLVKGAPPAFIRNAADRMEKARKMIGRGESMESLRLLKDARTLLMLGILSIDQILGIDPNLEGTIKLLNAQLDMIKGGRT